MLQKIYNVLNTWAQRVRRDVYWRIHPKRFSPGIDDIAIDRPIFLLGVQGGGLTLLSRMLRRHPQVVSVTGNYTYWAGSDEMQNVLGGLLPQELTGLHHKLPPHPRYQNRSRDNMYAIDDLLPLYRKTAADSTPELAARFRRIIRQVLAVYALDRQTVRFVDKSQSYTIRVALVNKLLEPYRPHFLLLTRNPYAMCYRAATRTNIARMDISFREKLQLASQHWANSIQCALEDGAKVERFMTVRFEDILRCPEKMVQKICGFVGLDFYPAMLPAAQDRIPFGSVSAGKWYPLRADVNQPYLQDIKVEEAAIVAERCGELARGFGYE